jgi:hypothetical protein
MDSLPPARVGMTLCVVVLLVSLGRNVEGNASDMLLAAYCGTGRRMVRVDIDSLRMHV